jgi:protein-disulfide isomerase
MRLVLAAAAVAVLASPAYALDKKEFEATLREVLQEKPEILVDALKQYQFQMEKSQKSAVAEVAAEIGKDKAVPLAGNAKGDVTVIEFFDYNCGYCHKVAPTVAEKLKEDTNTRWLFIDLPILSPQSKEAAKVALAAAKQGKYFETHLALMTRKGGMVDGQVARDVAKTLGLDLAKLEKDVASPEIEAAFARNEAWAKKIGVTGTPSFIVGSEMVPGAVDKEELAKLIAAARESKK